MRRGQILAGVDTGGTFTDFIFVHRNGVTVDKRPSRPADPVSVIREGVIGFLETIDSSASSNTGSLIERFAGSLVIVHGTTVPTNAILEGKTAPVCLVTNKGFEDLIEIGRQERLDLFHLPALKAVPPVARGLRFGVRQRTLHDGAEETPLSEGDVRNVVRRAGRSGVKSAAVCLLYSFLDPAPEQRMGKALEDAGFAVSLSSRVAPEFREYERFSTTVINASLKPVAEGYLGQLESTFPGAEILVMCSGGGVAPPAETAERPVTAILSGPAGGVTGVAALLEGRRTVKPARASRSLPPGKAITLDMGGTSSDVALVDGEPLRRHQSSILGLPLLVPSLDIHTVGAGGGSMVWCDRGGALRVGPESLGANPGPACYGKGRQPALTDAHLALGRLDHSGLLGGGFPLDPDRSADVLRRLADRLKVTGGTLCRGVLDVADAVLEKAIRVITLERGRDPGDFPLVAFGGAGGLHACRLMLSMGLPAVIVPPAPGVLSAAGIAGAELMEERSLGLPITLETGAVKEMRSAFRKMEEEWRRERNILGRLAVKKETDLRYRGQSFQLTLPFENGRSLEKRFHEAHLDRYGHNDPDASVEVVTIRARFVRSRSLPPDRLFQAATAGGAARRRPPRSAGMLSSLPGFGRKKWPLFIREELEPGHTIPGPAVVSEFSATTVVEQGCTLRVDEMGSLLLTPGGK